MGNCCVVGSAAKFAREDWGSPAKKTGNNDKAVRSYLGGKQKRIVTTSSSSSCSSGNRKVRAVIIEIRKRKLQQLRAISSANSGFEEFRCPWNPALGSIYEEVN